MSRNQIIGAVVAAVLLFWAVGGYNRLVQLRDAVRQRFVPVFQHVMRRHALLLQQLDALEPVLTNATPRIDSLRAACSQVEAACAHARQRTSNAGAVTSLHLAEVILGEARGRLPVQAAAGIDLAELNASLAAADAALAFARAQFNEAVTEYNQAVRQFPTRLLALVFSFQRGATL
ncbi:MAG: LemA family protein [Burkholderiaceae bacterium]